MNIPIGTKIKYQYEDEKDIFTVIGSRNVRGKYVYIIQNSKNEKSTITRSSILQAIQEKVFKFIVI